MAAESADVLIKKGKRQAAAYIRGVCTFHSNSDITNQIFDTILNPNVPIDDWDTIEWCRWLLAGGKTPDEYTQTVRRYDNATTCGLVWTANFVAYRCRTCGISPCMSLCSECFQRGNHEGHDFNMFRSQAGGACDCGDKSVMKESGFCHRHGSQNQINKPEVPPGLLCVAEALMPRLFLRLIQHLRDNSEPASLDKYHAAILLADSFLTLLHTHCEMGAAMRDVMTRALINPQLYFQLAVDCGALSSLSSYKVESLTKYLEAKNAEDDDAITAGRWCCVDTLKQSSFLDELVFWTIKFEFPQKLVCLLLNMMPDLNYKEAFTKIFVKHYDQISKMLAKSTESDTLSNRVVHVSVQLFSNEDLAYLMTKDHDLLKIMIDSLHSMMAQITHPSTLQCPEKNDHRVVDCSHRIMKEHCYWPLVSDLNNVLTHKAVAFEFLNDSDLLKKWFRFLYLFQGMNVNQRELKDHVEFESNTYYAAFAAELEASATPMWALISHLKCPKVLDKTKEILSICLDTISTWFQTIGFSLTEDINPYQVSFHIPLHRCFASFFGQAVRQQGATIHSLLPPENMLKLMMMHPLQTQVAFHEILSNMWVRSGLQIKGQAMTYIQCHFCNSVVDADLFLLQVCAMALDPDWFIKTVLQRFHVWEWFTFHPSRSNSFLENDKVLPMLEGALSFLATLLSTRTNIGQTEEEVTRQEMVTLLCMSNRTHSQLMDLLPDKCGATSQNKEFENILKKVADYKAPNFETGGTMVQGTFVPKPEVWEEEYDPIHVLFRAVHRREYQSSLDRYAQYLRQSNKFNSTRPPWPPYRIPGPVFKEFIDPRRILHSKTMHGIIFTILHRAVNDPDIPEQVLNLCIYLLDMAVRFPYTGDCVDENKQLKEVEDLKYEDWFDGVDTMKNISKVVNSVLMSEKVDMSMRMVEEMEVDEEIEEEMEIHSDFYDVQSPIVEEDFSESTQTNGSSTVQPQISAPWILSLPSTSNENQASSSQDSAGSIVSGEPVPSTSASTSHDAVSSSAPQDGASGSSSFNMALIPTSEGLATVRPKCMKLRQVPGRHRLLLSDKGLPLAIQCCHSEGPENRQMKCMFFTSKRSIAVNESILSLLLQLHSKLSEKPDSYQIKSKQNQTSKDCRIGDGVTFIERLIDEISFTNDESMEAIHKIKQKLWPTKETANSSPSMENMDRDERRRRAKERQQKLMAEFASKQRAFLEKTMESECSESASGSEEPLLNKEKEYECVICGQMTTSEEFRPVGMVVLLQATSVMGHCHQFPNRKLPCDEGEETEFNKGKTLAEEEEKKVVYLTQNFSNLHWPMAVNIGWQGGVHVQSCGHYLHIDCHKSYVQSLKSQNQLSSRLQNLAVDRGEYSCPLCRQLANSVIPLTPNYGRSSALVSSHSKELRDVALELTEVMTTPLSERETRLLKFYMGAIMEDITNATYPQYRSLCSPNSSSLFLFVCSISRINLEIELVQRGGNLTKPFKKKNCFVPLMHVLSMHARLLLPIVPNQVWTRLTGQTQSDHYPVAIRDEEVPLLLRDAVALLLQFVLTLPLNIDKAYYSCLVQVLYNFLFIQGLIHITMLMNVEQRNSFFSRAIERKKNTQKEVASSNPDLGILLEYVISNLQQSLLYFDDEKTWMEQDESIKDEESIEAMMSNYCLHYLRIAAVLQSHLYEEEIPEMTDSDHEFAQLCYYLNLTPEFIPNIKPVSCIKWVELEVQGLIDTWCHDYTNFLNSSLTAQLAGKTLMMSNFMWHPPTLLKLPENYDSIFKYYHKKPCSVCHSEPKDPSLCLVCGTMVCLRENCCRQAALYEAVSHSVACGAGTAMYLAVNSSTIIVIRGKRACLWGSVYLDVYGEEDRDLKRGKPLYLNEERYTLLQQQWINHSFDHTNKRWVWHKDNL